MGASSYRLLDAAHSNTIEDFLQHSRRRSKKTAQSWRVSGGLSALPHEPAQTTEAGKTKTESKPKQEKTYENQTISNQLKQSSAFDCLQRKACSDEAANSFDRHSRLWRARSTTPSWPDCSCTGPKAVQVQPGTSFGCYRNLPAECGGGGCRLSEGGRSRCGYAGFACRGPAAQYDLCGLPDPNAGASLRRGSVYRGFHNECGGQRVRPRGCHYR